MTPEVKERIDQIRHGIVPEGYIKSKDGIYPGDWTSKKMGQWLQLMERPISLEDNEKYELVTVRRGFGGVDSRGTYLGKNVLVKNYFCLCTGDFVISKRQIAHGACGVVPAELDGAVVSNEYNVFIPQEGTNINMFNLMMQLPHYRRLFYLMSDGVHIEKLLFKTGDWMRRSLAMPSLEEQEKIASILTMQDKIIELEQQKIEEIKKAKRFFLEKMFPKEGQAVPEIRFKGFTAPWEQRKLGEMGQTYTGLSGKTKDDFGHGQARFVTYMNVFSNPISNPEMTEPIEIDSKQNEVEVGDVFFTTSSETPEEVGMSSILLEKRGKTYLNSFCFGFRPSEKIDSYYLAYMLRSESARAKITLLAQGISRYNISKNKVMEIAISLPSLDEQKMIGQYFSHLDHLITLHQRKLEEEKRKKKTLMQLLLTGLVRVNA